MQSHSEAASGSSGLREYVDDRSIRLGCPVEWDADINEFAMPIALADQPLPGADPDLVRYAETLLEQQQSESLEAQSYAALARREIQKHDLRRPEALTLLVSDRLSCSARTLQRRLYEEGTSVHDLVDDERRGCSLDLLRTEMSLQDVADTTGVPNQAA